MWEMHDGWGWWMMFGWIWFLLFSGAVVFLVVWIANKAGTPAERETRQPLDIAKERLARGEIDEEEFQRLKQYLS